MLHRLPATEVAEHIQALVNIILGNGLILSPLPEGSAKALQSLSVLAH